MYFKLKYGHEKFIWKVLKINIYFGLENPKNQLNMILQKPAVTFLIYVKNCIFGSSSFFDTTHFLGLCP